MTQHPTPQRLFDAMDATWAPFAMHKAGPFSLREGRGGGQRVSAANLTDEGFEAGDIDLAEDGMKRLGQRSLFQVRPQDQELDAELARRGYQIVDPVTLYVGETAAIGAMDQRPESLVSGPFGLEMMAKAWAKGGIERARIDVMDRVAGAKRYMLLRHDNRPAGAGFVAADGDVAMLHALEVSPIARRQGIGRTATAYAGQWAGEQGARWLALATVKENAGACALYESMGFEAVAAYHYRRAP